MDSDWQEVIHRVAPLQHSQVPLNSTVLAFDTDAELLWLGTDQGYVQSCNGCELRRYTSYRGHNSLIHGERPVRQLLFSERGVVSLAARSLHLSSRGGPTLWNLQDERFRNLTSLAFTSRGTSEALVGGTQQQQMFTVNLERGTIASEIPTDDDVKLMKRSARHIITSSSKGHIRLLDMNSFSVVKQFDHVHTGTILDMDTHDNLLITCGYSLRHSSYIVDPLVKVFDLRMQKALPPVSFPGASFIQMHPKMSAAAIIGSSTGQFQIVDVMNPGAMKIYNATTSSYITAMQLSPTGDVLALVDAEGVLQMWSSMGKRNFTEFGNLIEWPEPPTRSTVSISDNTPLNVIGMPYFNEPLLSNWDPNLVFEVPRQPQQRIDPDTLAATSVSGYAPFHKRHPRNFVEKSRGSSKGGTVPAPKFLSQQARDKNSKNPAEAAIAESMLLYGDDSKRQFEVPPMYKKHEIKYSKFGIEDFDFAFYNETNYSGLETNIQNSYMNPLLQLYKYTPRLRNVALFHTASYCALEECLLCQMGFLFDMLEKANGQNCQATNLLKTLSSLPNAARLGVLEEDSSTTGTLTMMMQNLNRFLLDQTIYDLKNQWQSMEESELPRVVLVKATKRQQCMVCHKETRPMGDTVTTDLIYSPKPPGNKALPTFAQTIRQSIQLETTQKGWCDKCRRYHNQHTRKSITKLPDVLTFNVTTQNKSPCHAKDYWSTPGWLPDEIGLTLNNKLLNVWQGEDLKRVAKRSNDQADLRIYELIGFVAEVKEEETKKHMVSFINVSLSSENWAEGESNWHLFNDFLVRPVTKAEALDFTPKWKMPSVLCFQLKSDRSIVDNSWKSNIDTSLLYHDFQYLGHLRREEHTILLSDDEAPQKGTLVALDAEFVSLQKEENEVKADGNKIIVRPSRLGLARVSVLRGQSELEGVPFIDDYIATREPVVDFLTEYSGIHPGDLDPLISRRALVSLKVAYKRMWILLNLGCTFIGHGLLKDFRIINIHVPRDQVIDTVDLFVLRATQRKLSLRFLAWVVLSDHIQTETHDSIEDSRTALRLYRKYLEYCDAGVFEEVMNRIFAEGMRWNFRPPTHTPPAVKDLQRLEAEIPRSEGTTPQPGSNRR